MREYFIISQALYLAVKVLEGVDGGEREVSNIIDMHKLIDHEYPLYKSIQEVQLNNGTNESFVIDLKKKNQDTSNED